MKCRAIFISDLHMGLRASQADRLLDFLHHHSAPTIYLVGDIVDFWALKRNSYWPLAYNKLIHYLFAMSETGTQIFYLPGNHDGFLELCYGDYGNLHVVDRVVHTTANGVSLLVLHGHQADFVSTNIHWLERLGDWAYDWALIISGWVTTIRDKFGLPYWSFSAWAKHVAKYITTFIEGFQNALEQEARSWNCQGVICGHIHTPVILHKDDFIYCNTGDWVESMSAVIENQEGELELIHWNT